MKVKKGGIGQKRLVLLRYFNGDYKNKILQEVDELMNSYVAGRGSDMELHATTIKYLLHEEKRVFDEVVQMDYYKVKALYEKKFHTVL